MVLGREDRALLHPSEGRGFLNLNEGTEEVWGEEGLGEMRKELLVDSNWSWSWKSGIEDDF